MSLDPLYRPLLDLRPTNAVHLLGSAAPVPLLSAREVVPALGRLGLPWWGVRLAGAALIPAVLRAAAQARAVSGLVLAPSGLTDELLRGAQAPAPFFNATRQAAESQPRVCPFVLALEQPPGPAADAAAEERLRAYLVRAAESGFGSFVLRLPQDESGWELFSTLLGDLAPFAPGLLLRCGPDGEASALTRARELAEQRGLEVCAWLRRPGDDAGREAVSNGGWLLGPDEQPPGPAAVVVTEPEPGPAAAESREAMLYLQCQEWIETLGLRGSAPRLAAVLLQGE